MMKAASPQAQSRYIATWDDYTKAVIEEAQDRMEQRSRTIDEYFVVRRDTIGALPCFAANEFEVDLPEEALDHPVVASMREWALDLIHIGNVSAW